MKTPVELLKEKLTEYEKALQKSFIAFREGGINLQLHETHKANLEPMIFKYKQAITCLNQWLD
jgi:hypothetical protein